MSATKPSNDPAFSMAVLPDRQEVAVVPHGDLDAASADALQHEVRELRSSGFDRIVLDLRHVTFIDSVGLRRLLSLRNDALRDGYGLKLVPGPPDVQRIFEVTVTRSLFDWRDY